LSTGRGELAGAVFVARAVRCRFRTHASVTIIADGERVMVNWAACARVWSI